MRIVADRDISQAESAFSEFGDVSLVGGRGLNRDELADAEILLVRSVTRVDAELLDGTNVAFVGTATSGIDHIDTDYLCRRGIPYFHAAGCNARAVAEYVLACSFLHQRLTSREPGTLQAGIIGFGHVGKSVYAMLTALGIHCVINDPPLADSTHDKRFVELDDVLNSDIVTLHVPYTALGDYPTHGLIGLKQLGRLKPDALLINAARGGVVEEKGLVAWLKERPRAAAAIDCWVGEPVVDLELLRQAALVTPHIAGHTREARLRATTMLAQNISGKLGMQQRWRPSRERPADLHLDPPGRMKTTDVLRSAILRCCDPRTASEMMRKMLGLPAAHRAGEFDKLRRHAATRREFAGYRIASDTLQSDTVDTLRELGFDMTTGGRRNGVNRPG